MPQSRQLAAIMFTDIVGYTALMGKDSAKALELVRISKEIQKPLVERHHGIWLKEMGDGILAQFNSALDAVNCAIEIQKSARAELDAKLRIGIHSGDVTVKDNDVYGDGVNVASRLESIADPGGIYISDSIEKAIRGQSNVQAKYLGEIKLRNVDYDVRTYALQGVGLPVPDLKEDKNLSGRFIAELQRRGVLRAVATYIVLSILLILVFPYVISVVDLPTWLNTVLYSILIAGFPIALYMAWNYERSPEGFVRTNSRESWQNPYKASQRKPMTSNLIILVLILIITFMFLNPLNIKQTEKDVAGDTENSIIDRSIAVLPFKDDSESRDNQYFCDGMMDEILNHLQKIADLGVKSRTAVEPYRNNTKSFSTIANELGVSYILEGAVRKYGNRFRITTQLIDVKSGNHLWAETYDGIFSDTIFVVQSSIAKKVAASLQAVITPEEEQRIDDIPTTNITAYDLNMRAKHEIMEYWKTVDNKHLDIAHILLDNALRIDPEYFGAILGKGTTFMAGQNFDSALIYANRALAIKPDDPWVYSFLGECYFFMRKSDLAIENYLKAIDLSPENEGSWPHIALGRVYMGQKNDVPKALPYFSKALEKTSDNEISPALYLGIAASFLNIGAYEKAEEYFIKTFNLESSCLALSFYSSWMKAQGKFQEMYHSTDSICEQIGCEWQCRSSLFEATMLLGEFEKAEQYFIQWKNTTGRLGSEFSRDFQIGYVYDRLGKKEEAERIFNKQIKELKTLLDKKTDDEETPTHSTFLYLARIYAFQGNRTEAIKYLSEYARRGFTSGWHDFILIDPFFEKLRDDPEFKAIVKKAQDEKAALRAQVREMQERGEIDL